jgi:hypothetical protein
VCDKKILYAPRSHVQLGWSYIHVVEAKEAFALSLEENLFVAKLQR